MIRARRYGGISCVVRRDGEDFETSAVMFKY